MILFSCICGAGLRVFFGRRSVVFNQAFAGSLISNGVLRGLSHIRGIFRLIGQLFLFSLFFIIIWRIKGPCYCHPQLVIGSKVEFLEGEIVSLLILSSSFTTSSAHDWIPLLIHFFSKDGRLSLWSFKANSASRPVWWQQSEPNFSDS